MQPSAPRPCCGPGHVGPAATRRPPASDLPSSAAAPQIFSAITVMPTPRRPAVYRLSCTATSSLVSDDRFDLDALSRRQVRRHLEVQHVARVVLHDVQNACAAVDGLGRLEHLVGRRRREDLARTGGVEHPAPDEPAVHRLVARAAAGDDSDLALHRRIDPHHDQLRIALNDSGSGQRARRLHALQCLADHVVRGIDELLHRTSSSCGRSGTYRTSHGRTAVRRGRHNVGFARETTLQDLVHEQHVDLRRTGAARALLVGPERTYRP